MLEEHARETSKYKAEIEVLREILQLKLEAISIRLMRNILLDAPFKVVCIGIQASALPGLLCTERILAQRCLLPECRIFAQRC